MEMPFKEHATFPSLHNYYTADLKKALELNGLMQVRM